MFEFIKNLFKKVTPIKSGDSLSIDITGQSISVNGRKIVLPADINKISAFLGTPRAQEYDTNLRDKKFLEQMHKNASVTNRVNYMWDELGIKCYTLDGRTVNTFAIELNQGILSYPNTTAKLFGGTVTINGRPWVTQINAGTDLEVIQQLTLGKYSLVCEYTDTDSQAALRTEKDYVSIEIGIAK